MNETMTDILRCLAAKADSFYLYGEAEILCRASALKAAFPEAEFLYSVKCNPNRHILRSLAGCGFGADAASAGEVSLAAEAGIAPERIFYSAPGKSESDLRSTIGSCTVIADSLTEARRIAEIAGGAPVSIGLRVNPDFSMDGEGGAPSKFGVDEAEALAFLQANPYANVRVSGIHVHVRSQVLDTAKLAFYYQHVLALAERAEAAAGHPLAFVNMGSGIGTAYSQAEADPDVAALGRTVSGRLAAFRAAHPGTRVLIETGRYSVCRAGVYVTHVTDRKTSHGHTYVFLQNTLNGFLRPSLACLLEKASMPAPAEPLYTGRNAFPIEVSCPDRAPERVTLCGNLCTAADTVAEDILLPRLEPGDLVILHNAGAYAAALSPVQFSAQRVPREFMLLRDGSIAE